MSQIDFHYRVNLTLNIESIGLSISSQFDSQYRVNLILNIESIWLSISSQFDSQYRVNLTLNIESIWFSISSQFDSQYRVNLTLNVESIWLSISSQFDSNILQLLRIPGWILVPPVTQLFRSKWLHFFFQWTTARVPAVGRAGSKLSMRLTARGTKTPFNYNIPQYIALSIRSFHSIRAQKTARVNKNKSWQ